MTKFFKKGSIEILMSIYKSVDKAVLSESLEHTHTISALKRIRRMQTQSLFDYCYFSQKQVRMQSVRYQFSTSIWGGQWQNTLYLKF